MKALLPLSLLLAFTFWVSANTFLDDKVFGEHLGGWTDSDEKAATYEISGSRYRTWKPTATPTPDGGTFISVRIDHIRGLFASDDHASLEITINTEGEITSARSGIAIQGKKITSDLIRGASDAAGQISGVSQAAKIGTDLIADLTSKLFREKVTEAGRVTFPAAVQHNYNLLCQALWDKKKQITPEEVAPPLSDTEQQEQQEQQEQASTPVNITQTETTEAESPKTETTQKIRKAPPFEINSKKKPLPLKK